MIAEKGQQNETFWSYLQLGCRQRQISGWSGALITLLPARKSVKTFLFSWSMALLESPFESDMLMQGLTPHVH
jgi:hypothetical protein